MKLSVASWSFAHCTLKEAAVIAHAIGVEAMDLGYLHAPAIDRYRVLHDPERYAQQLRADLPIPPACLFHRFGADRLERNLGLPPNEENLGDLRQALRFCHRAGIRQLFLLPGMINPGQTRREALAYAAAALQPVVAAGAEVGVTVGVEPHVQSTLESPEHTGDLLTQVPGLMLVLDAAHFIAQGYPQSEVEGLVPYASHVHLRQARPGALQTPLADGTINFPSLFAALHQANYIGWLSIEVLHQAYMNTLHEDVLTETIRLRDCFRAWARLNK